MRRLAIVLSHPVQYYSPWFRWLQREGRLDLKVFYLWNFGVTNQRDPEFGATFQWDVDLLAGYESEFVPNIARDPGTHHFQGLNNPTLVERLQTWKPDAVLLFGYAYRSHLRVIIHPPAPLIFRGDSHFVGRRPSWLKRFVLRQLYARFAAVTYVGDANHDYFRVLGVPAHKLFFAPHSVDCTRFSPEDPATRAAAAALRAELKLGTRRVVLFAGKFNPGKQPVELLQAFLQVAASPYDALVFVGDGADKTRLEAIARDHPSQCVRFLPFANQSEMPARYLLADIFALPSVGETWGLAVNEAMHLGVPCLVSDRVGCQRDLVHPGETGWVFPIDKPGALAETLQTALRTPSDELARLKTKARATIAHYTYAQTSDGLLQALASLPST